MSDAPKIRMSFLVLQEGGSTGELYVHTFEGRGDANAFRRSAARAAYRTTRPLLIPPGFDVRHAAAFAESVAREWDALGGGE